MGRASNRKWQRRAIRMLTMGGRRARLNSDVEKFVAWQREIEYAGRFKARKLDRAVRTLIRGLQS